MAFRRKAQVILAQRPDILIVPECEHPDKLIFDTGIPKPTDFLWYGTNHNKGLGIFSFSNFRFSLLNGYDENFKLIIPISVTGGEIDFNLFAVWANNPLDKDGHYIEQVWKALLHYDEHLNAKSTLLIGDFNSNTIWDKQHRESNHSNVVKLLEAKGIYSLYHTYHQQSQGTEAHATFYLYKHREKGYHIDYCFASAGILGKVRGVDIGDFDTWIKHSDHVPVMVTIDLDG
jgi:exodeoxyribonuclease III